jgi:hypothetical protein
MIPARIVFVKEHPFPTLGVFWSPQASVAIAAIHGLMRRDGRDADEITVTESKPCISLLKSLDESPGWCRF